MTCTSCNRESFHNEARSQLVCAGCESAKKPWHAHHVVHEQHLKAYGGHKWDPRNALRLCIPRPDGCHWTHHNKRKPLKTSALTDSNIEFAVELMGAGRAVDYLRRYYDDSTKDPRLEALMRHDRIDFDAIRALIDPAGGHAVMFGSAVLYLHGLRDRIGDVEFFVTKDFYDETYYRWPGTIEHEPAVGDPPYLELDVGAGVPVNLFYAWCPWDFAVEPGQCFRHVEMHAGWPCCPLWLVRQHKVCALEIIRSRGVTIAGSRWEKHERDLEAIDGRLELVAA